MSMKSVPLLAVGLVSIAAAAMWLSPGGPRRDPDPALAGAPDPVILAAGDIASCTSTDDDLTANLLDTLPGTILALGDLAYESGTATEFTNCYHPTWGRHKARTMPSPGNHEYNTPGATGYYGYFGAAAGDPTKGYYSFDSGTWHLIALNSNCAAVGGCGAGSTQELWLRNDLATHPAQCTLAFWHHPRFSSSAVHGSSTTYQPFFQALYEYGADVTLVGHDHNYERFAPQTATGVADAAFGVREFVVGTGGRAHYGFGAIQPNSEVRNDTAFGVLQMTLHPASYDFEFKPAVGSTLSDSGSTACHGAALDPDADGWLNAQDNCPAIANAGQENADSNFIDQTPPSTQDDRSWPNSDAAGDACDADDDNDGLADSAEAVGCNGSGPLNPLLRDTDGDRFLDGAECTVEGGNPSSAAAKPTPTACGAAGDADGDRIATRVEVCNYNTDPADNDTDNDLDGSPTPGLTKDGCEAASINNDRVVNSGDQLLMVVEIVREPTPSLRLVSMDVNKDGAVNSGDQLTLALFIAPAGQCP